MAYRDLRILVVDDNRLQLSLIQRTFVMFAKFKQMPFGVCVDVADCVDEALEIIESSPFYDFIISDIEMPERNGFELFRELKNMQYPAKVIANSSDPIYRNACMDCGCMEFQDKSRGSSHLFDLICSVVPA